MIEQEVVETKKWTPMRETPQEFIYQQGFDGPKYGVTMNENHIVVLRQNDGGEWYPTTHFPVPVMRDIEEMLSVVLPRL